MVSKISPVLFSNIRQRFRFFIYLFVGVVSAVADTYCLYFLNKTVGWNLELSVTVGFIVGLLVNYILHSFLTFKRKIEISTFIKYLTVVAVNYIITLALVKLLVSGMNVNLIASKIIILPIIAIIGYVLSKAWIYRE